MTKDLSKTPPGLVGTWELIALQFQDLEGNIIPWDAWAGAVGVIMYTEDGHMSVQLAQDAERPKFGTLDPDEWSDADIIQNFKTYDAYYGPYGFVRDKDDPYKGLVSHCVVESMIPDLIGLEQRKVQFSEDGNTLILVGTTTTEIGG
ncbi:MAG: lipocalin-like domain-containing protein, partial [bacterium]|nr:lipocalin-like domain-containing protein [bacterium]